jgi:tetratricopeptide (TPR) repeat protein
MRRVLLFLLLMPSGLLAQDSIIVSLESRLNITPDAQKDEVRHELARQYFFYSFKYPDSTEFRQATLAKGLSIAQESRDTLLVAAHHLELTHFLPNDSAVKVLNFYKPILDSILKRDFSNTLASLVYASMSIEILKLGGFKKFLAKLFYGARPEVDYDRALLHLLQVKLEGEFLAVTYYRLAECYFALHNHRDALGSLNACLKAEERYPYLDAYFKREAKARLERYQRERR